MKKITIISICLFAFSIGANSQVHKHSFGMRFSPLNLYRGSMLNYQYGIDSTQRLDFGLSFSGRFAQNDFAWKGGRLSAYYQRVWNIKGGLNWYLGAGLEYQLVHQNSPFGPSFYNRLGFGPQIGLEYDFNKHNIPVILGLDYRPTFSFYPGLQKDFIPEKRFQHNVGLSLRYNF